MLVTAAGVVAELACNLKCVEESGARNPGDQGLSLRARTPASASIWSSPAASEWNWEVKK